MTESLSEIVRKAGESLTKSTGTLSVDLINQLNKLLGPSFQTVPGIIRDATGAQSERLSAIVRPVSSSGVSDPVPADSAACAIECLDRIDLSNLGTAYRRIASAKRLKKTPPPPGTPKQTATLGVIVARHADASFEALAAELDRLHRSHPDCEWTDMLAVLSIGSVSFAVQFPGEKGLGDFLPPDPAANKSGGGPPVYVVLTMRAVGEYTFNRLLGLILSQLFFSRPVLSSHRTLRYSRMSQRSLSPCGAINTT